VPLDETPGLRTFFCDFGDSGLEWNEFVNLTVHQENTLAIQ